MELFKVIKDRRALLDLTQQDLADITGVGLRTIKLIESAKGNPSVGTLSKLGQALGLDLIFQLRRTDNL
jgi:transcriptional regulator with XRE-family HTH domain